MTGRIPSGTDSPGDSGAALTRPSQPTVQARVIRG
jgi:hypothetical protein